ncbi:unnamed protein product, partial [Adineta ricciae]
IITGIFKLGSSIATKKRFWFQPQMAALFR